jgi:hypothetical protein
MIRTILPVLGLAAGLTMISSGAFATPNFTTSTFAVLAHQTANAQAAKSRLGASNLILVDTMQRDGDHSGRLRDGDPYDQGRFG